MKKIEFKDDAEYLGGVVRMLVGLDKLEVDIQTLFLIEVVRESAGGYMVNDMAGRKVIMDRMRISEVYFNKMVGVLSLKGYLRRDNGIIYVHPKFRAVKESEGNFLVSVKKSLGDTE